LAPPDAIFGLVKAFQADPRPNKVNLLIGFYKTEEGKTPLLESVKKAEGLLLHKEKNKEYLPIDGHPAFIEKIGMLIFGDPLWKKSKETIYGAQTIGGTGALRILGDFLRKELASDIWVSDPTWANHKNIFTHAGLRVQQYPYYDRNKQRLIFDEMVAHLSKLPKGSVILLHSNCHNPTGFDLSFEQWKELSTLFLDKELFPFFDVAYQGFGLGIDEDLKALRYFVEQGHEMAIAYSCAKNFSLYGERAGALYLVDGRPKNRQNIESQIKAIIRANYSNPPIHAASIVSEILNSPQLTEDWKKDLEQMRLRIIQMRQVFIAALLKKQIPYDVEFMEHSKGLFCFSGLEKHHVDILIANYGIYLPSDGRINVTGLNMSNLDYIVSAVAEVVAYRPLA
jgi:aspartate/tyrosine/aromatic aminotransferase